MSDTQLAVRPKASQQLAQLIGMQPEAMLDTIKAQCFKTAPGNVTDAQLAAFVSIAADMGVNPLLPGMLYAYPISGGGIIPIMGPDGIYKKLSEREDIDSWETEVFPVDVSLPPTHAITKIWRKNREKPLSYTALLSEWKINSNPNWNSRPRHMLALRSLKHAARQIIHGLPGDEDDRHIMNEIDVTPRPVNADGSAAGVPERPAPPPRKSKGATAAQEKPIDVAATVVTEPPKPVTPTETPKPAETPPAAPVEPKAKVEPKAGEPRTSLNEAEEITVRCVVQNVFTLVITADGVPSPCVQAEVKGEFEGKVYHIGGATKNGAGELVAPAPWKKDNEVTLVLFGKINKKTSKVLPAVKSIALTEGSANTPIDV